eukprot:2604594-Alexandrium_andersonii.AAC.1
MDSAKNRQQLNALVAYITQNSCAALCDGGIYWGSSASSAPPTRAPTPSTSGATVARGCSPRSAGAALRTISTAASRPRST